MRGRRRILELNYNVAGARASFLRVATVVSAATGVSMAAILEQQLAGRPNRGRKDPKTFARLATTYLTVTSCNVRQGTLARMLGRHRRRILDDVRRIEDARDDAKVDALLDRLEAML